MKTNTDTAATLKATNPSSPPTPDKDPLFTSLVSAISNEVLSRLIPTLQDLTKANATTVTPPTKVVAEVTAAPSLKSPPPPPSTAASSALPASKKGRPRGSKNKVLARSQFASEAFQRTFTAAFSLARSVQDVIDVIPELRSLPKEQAHQYVISHASYLRKQGIALKYLPRGRAATKANQLHAAQQH